MKLTPFTPWELAPFAGSNPALPTAHSCAVLSAGGAIGKARGVSATESEAVVEDSLQEAVRQSNGRRQFSRDLGSIPRPSAVHPSTIGFAAEGSSSGRAPGRQSSVTILNAVTDSMPNKNRSRGAGYALRGRLLQGATVALWLQRPTVAGSTPASATSERQARHVDANLSDSGAPGGQICGLFSVARSGAETSALMRSARSEASDVCERPEWPSLVGRRGSANYAEVARSNRASGPTPKPGIAQPKESASRLASVALSVTGSGVELGGTTPQPASLREAA